MKNKKADSGHAILILIVFFLAVFFGWFALTGKISLGEDTDGDGLSDEKERKIGTNITNPNTDGDRYLDGEDKNPLKINSANIKISLTEKDWDWSSVIVNAISLFLKVGSLSSETVIADTHVKILIENLGDDYTSYVNYDLIYEIAGQDLRKLPTRAGSLGIGEERTLSYEEKILLKDVPDILMSSLSKGDLSWDIRYENLNYESFS